MEPHSDVDLMKAIYRAEREAERIVREAEEAARALLAEAESAARDTLEAKSHEFGRREREKREKETAETEKEAQALLERTRLQVESWVRRSEPEIDSIADALLDRILPS
jgi:vacuolar-type H+-ATPase subunit H